MISHTEVAVWGVVAADPLCYGRRPSSKGRNEKMHLGEHRDKGPDIFGKVDRDNAGKDLLSAGACSNPQRLGAQGIKAEASRDNRFGA
jgi:hypothetical protein